MADPTQSGLTSFLRASLRQGMTVIDIGANVGDVTGAAADLVGTTGRVIAYEPSPSVALGMRSRFRGHSQVEIRQSALSDHVGRALFYVDPSKSTSSTLFSGAIGPDYVTLDVSVRTLNDESPLLPEVDLIKVDAQGAEARIFEAGRRLLKRDKPLLVFEVWPSGLRAAGSDPIALLDRLAGLGYHFHPLNMKGRLGNPEKIRALIAGETRSKAMNIVAHPRRWPGPRWREDVTPLPCMIPPRYRALCRPWHST